METACELSNPCILTESFCEDVSRHLKYVVRRRLNRLVRPHLDSIDVTQMVWKSFLRHDQARFTDWNKKRLRGYLNQVLENKIKEIHRKYLSAQKRDVRRNSTESEKLLSVHATTDISPGRKVENAENWSRLCHVLTAVERRVLSLRLQGMALKQIAEQVELHTRTVQKIMRRVRKKFVETVVDE